MKTVPFAEAITDVSRGNEKIPKSAFLPSGAVPIIDQGRSVVAGYTNDQTSIVHSKPPVIVFGDHTRALKFVDFPFAVGADGVKLLKTRQDFDPKYVYHYLRSRRIPSLGYSRHFKVLKETRVPQPPLDEQRRIVTILDQADAIRAKRRQVLAHLDSLTQAMFREMFGDLAADTWDTMAFEELVSRVESGTSPNCESRPANEKEWGVLKLGAVTYGTFKSNENKAFIGDVRGMTANEVHPGDVLMTRKNTRELVGAVALVDDVRPGLLIPDLIFRLHLDHDRLDRQYFQALMMNLQKRPSVRDLSSGSASSMPNISKARLATLQLEVPPLSLQRSFAAKVNRAREPRAAAQRALAADDELFASLQSRAFCGEL